MANGSNGWNRQSGKRWFTDGKRVTGAAPMANGADGAAVDGKRPLQSQREGTDGKRRQRWNPTMVDRIHRWQTAATAAITPMAERQLSSLRNARAVGQEPFAYFGNLWDFHGKNAEVAGAPAWQPLD